MFVQRTTVDDLEIILTQMYVNTLFLLSNYLLI